MSKLIILCEHAVETLTYFSRQLAGAFESWGYEIFWMDFDRTAYSAWKLQQAFAVHPQEAVFLTFNFIGLSGEEELWEYDAQGRPSVSIWQKYDIFCLNIMVDHPIYYYKALQYHTADMQTFCVDRDHAAYMKRFYPQIPCVFLPLAGNLLPENLLDENDLADKFFPYQNGHAAYVQWQNRPYAPVFTANYVPTANIEKQLLHLEPEYRDFYFEIIDAFVKNPKQDLLSCMEAYLRREIPDLDDAQLCEGMSSMPAVDLWIRTYFREKTVRILAEGGIRVHVFGKDWEQMRCKKPENIISSGRMVTSADCARAMADGKLALNTMPWFKDGAHDRIFTAMLQGAVALTDGSVYLEEQFAHMDTIVYYDLCELEALPALVSDLMRDTERLYQIAVRAAGTARRRHTWAKRAEVLKCYIDKCESLPGNAGS